MDAPTITLGTSSATLAPPPMLAAVALARDQAQIEAMTRPELHALQAAALAVCWPSDCAWPIPLRPRPWRCTQRIEDYGQQVFDALAAGGLPPLAILRAIQPALGWALSHLVGEDEVRAAQDFSGPPQGG